MKQTCLHLIALLCAFLLTSCCGSSGCFKLPASCVSGNCFSTQNDVFNETWLNQVETSPNAWIRRADSWFLTGNPNEVELNNLHNASEAITTMKVRVSDFSNINSNGSYHLQIVGHQKRNSVTILGPNDAARLVGVTVHNGTLYIHQAPHCDPAVCTPNLYNVIVRVGVRNLRSLTNNGPGEIYGRVINSDRLSIYSLSSGHIMIAGDINLAYVVETGSATVTVMGAYTPSLRIEVLGPGNLNISGRVGVQSIVHNGDGDINIIGTDSDNLTIYACGFGKTALTGFANLKQVKAYNYSRVFLYWDNSNSTDVYGYDNARIGIAGHADTLNVNMEGSSCFQGEYLQADAVYVRTRYKAHADVATHRKLFAEANDTSSIYYFGSPVYVEKFPFVKSQIISITDNGGMLPPMPRHRPSPWNSPGPY